MPIPAILLPGLKLPVIAAPMFLVSGTRLVSETCKQGMIGTLPALNARSSSELDDWLHEIDAALDGQDAARYGVMLVMHKSNQRLEQDLEIVLRHRVPLVITAVGHRPDVVAAVHAAGSVVFHDAVHMQHALKAAQAGVDGIIAICAGSGGHTGTLNPFAFASQLRAQFAGSIVLAGGIGHGRQLRAAQILGADFAYMGTRFIATEEAGADPRYKQMILEAESTDIVLTDRVSGIAANFLRESLAMAGIDANGTAATPGLALVHQDEMQAWRDLWSAGHGVGLIHDVPSVAALAQRLKAEFRATFTP